MKIKKRNQNSNKFGGQTDLAKLMNCSQSAVSQMVTKGVVKVRKDGKIDLAQAKKDWNAHVTPATIFGKRDDTKKEAEAHTEDTKKDSERFYKARADREEAEASIKQMEMRQRQGELFEAEDVKEFIFSMARASRDNLLRISKRVSPMLVGLDERGICRKLDDEIHQALRNLTESVLTGKYDTLAKKEAS